MKALFVVALLLAGVVQAQTPGQTVWRCGADGRSYSDEPCPGGRAVRVADARTRAQVLAANAVAERDKLLASALMRERHQRETAVPGAAAGFKPALKPPAAKLVPAKSRWPEAVRTSRAKPRETRQRQG